MALSVERRRGCPTETIDRLEELLALFEAEGVKATIAQVRSWTEKEREAAGKGDLQEQKKCHAEAAKLKRDLPGVVFQCSSFKEHEWKDRKQQSHGVGRWRHQEHCVLNGLFMVDIDHVDDPDALWKKLTEQGVAEWQPCLAFKTPSGHGLKIVMPADAARGNLTSNQRAFAKAFGVEVDENTKDASRLSFVATREDIYLIDERIVTYENKEFIDKYNGKYNDGSSDADLFDGADKPHADTLHTESSQPELGAWLNDQFAAIGRGDELPVEDTYENRFYKGLKIRDIINAYFDGNPPHEGERHDAMLKLACDLRHVVDRNPRAVYYFMLRLPFVQDLYKEGDPVEASIAGALEYKYTSFMPKKMKLAIDKLKSMSATEDVGEVSEEQIKERLNNFGLQLKALFEYFPTMKEATAKYNPPSYPAVLFSTACLYGTLATKTWYYHYHEPEYMRRLNYEVFVIADPAQGKSGISNLYKLILAPMIAGDKVYNDAINKSKKSRKKFDATPEKSKKEPVVVVESKVRIHGSRTANNVFIEDMVNNVEMVGDIPLHLHLFTFDSELEAAAVASKGGQWIDKSIFELKAFHNEEDNQQYRNVDSVTGPFDVYWNFIYTGTPFSLYRKVTKHNFGSGLSTRLAVIPLCAEKFKMLPFRKATVTLHKNNETLKEWAFRLDSVKGELPIWPLVEYCWQWTDNLMTIAAQTEDEGLAFLIKRVSYYGINCSVPFIIMRHWDEFTKKGKLTIDEHDKELCGIFMEIQLYCQKIYFGRYTEQYFDDRKDDISEKASATMNTKTINLLDMLPDEFTVKEMTVACGIDRKYAYVLVNRWVREGLAMSEKCGRTVKYFKHGKKRQEQGIQACASGSSEQQSPEHQEGAEVEGSVKHSDG